MYVGCYLHMRPVCQTAFNYESGDADTNALGLNYHAECDHNSHKAELSISHVS